MCYESGLDFIVLSYHSQHITDDIYKLFVIFEKFGIRSQIALNW